MLTNYFKGEYYPEPLFSLDGSVLLGILGAISMGGCTGGTAKNELACLN